MKIKLDIWVRLIGRDNKPYTKLLHEEFSEEEIIDALKEKLKGNYHEPFDIEIAEITSR